MAMSLNRWPNAWPKVRPNLVVLAAAIGVVALTARLGFWQLDRAAQKETLQAAMQSQAALLPLAASALPSTRADGPVPTHRRALLQGQWLPNQSIYLDNRPMNGRTGFYLVTPLLLADGSAVLVQRGWLPRDPLDRSRVAPPPGTSGTVTVQGRIAPELARLYEFDAAGTGAIRQNLVIDTYAQEAGLPLRPWALVQEEGPEGPAALPDGLLRQWPAPASGLHKHYGYAFQWFSLCALTFVLYVWFQFIRPHRRARQNPR